MRKPLTGFIRPLWMTAVFCLLSGAALGGQYRPGDTFRDCDDCPEMVVIPSGSYMMGSPSSEEGWNDNEGPRHRVTIGQPFAVGVYEVTFGEWDACVAGGGCGFYRPDDLDWGRGRRPVMNTSWEDGQAYIRWLSKRTGKRYRLLSESEWEYVARAETEGPYHFGRTITSHEANYNDDPGETTPGGSYPANAFGLHDVHGNVGEWTQDCWNESYAGAPADGSAWESGYCERRVLRGGSWYGNPGDLRSAFRLWGDLWYRDIYVGFRVARTLD